MKKFFGEGRGSFTIESTLVFPIVSIMTLVLIFGSLYFYQKAALYYTASAIADRTAYVWDNSYKDPQTGSFEPGQSDGLYWRLTQDSVSDIFSFFVHNAPVVLKLPENRLTEGMKGPLRKLQRGASQLDEGSTGMMTYTNRGFDRRILVQLSSKLQIPAFADSFLSDQMNAEASSGVVAPVEFIRSVELIQTYSKELVQRNISEQAANEAFQQFNDLQSPASFDTHRQAQDYLQKLVSGKEVHYETTYGKRRLDALNRQGISHQAYLTFNEKNLSLQLAKDAELLEKGEKVNGIVWHFFRRTNQSGKVGPSKRLLADIESKGIVVIIHD